MEKLASYWNTASVSLKVVVTLVGLVGYGALFYFQTDDHMSDSNIHVTAEAKKEVQSLKDRIELLEWELVAQRERCTKRHNRQEAKLK